MPKVGTNTFYQAYFYLIYAVANDRATFDGTCHSRIAANFVQA